jgi:hypothetical protein
MKSPANVLVAILLTIITLNLHAQPEFMTSNRYIDPINIDDGKSVTKKGDGVRLYYGMYNDKVCDLLTRIAPNQGDFSSHLDHNTVFFVPTYEIAGGDKHIDDISPETVAKYRDDYENGRDLGHKFGGGFNVGNICPPPPPSEIDCSRSGSNL